MKIGERIKERRTELGWSQRDLASKMGYNHHSTVARIEAGSVDIPQSRIVKFAEVLGVSLAYLMDWEDTEKEKSDENDGLSENMKTLIEFAKSVPEDKAELVLRVIRSIVEDDR